MSNLWNPTIEVESAHGTREVSLNTRHMMERLLLEIVIHMYILAVMMLRQRRQLQNWMYSQVFHWWQNRIIM